MRPSPFHRHMEALIASEAPIPLTPREAVAQAYRLRSAGLSYEGIAVVMRAYHGSSWVAATWRKKCRAQGIPASPRGVNAMVAMRRSGKVA